MALPEPAAWEEEAEQPSRTVDLSIPDLDAAEEDLQDQATRRSRREGETRKALLTALEARADLADRLVELHEQLGHERGRNEELCRRVADLEAELEKHSAHIERLQDELREVRDERLVLLEKLSGLHARRADLYFTWAREEESQRRAAETGREAVRRERDLEVQDLRERLSAAEGLLNSVVAAKSRDEEGEAEHDDFEDGGPRKDWNPWRRSRRPR
ncbi:hypothetical protein NKH77_50405 [Streptomyces sp. M19]